MKKNKNNYAVIMAGGLGSRFWPLSKKNYPKQFHDILGVGKSLLQLTYDRYEKLEGKYSRPVVVLFAKLACAYFNTIFGK